MIYKIREITKLQEEKTDQGGCQWLKSGLVGRQWMQWMRDPCGNKTSQYLDGIDDNILVVILCYSLTRKLGKGYKAPLYYFLKLHVNIQQSLNESLIFKMIGFRQTRSGSESAIKKHKPSPSASFIFSSIICEMGLDKITS